MVSSFVFIVFHAIYCNTLIFYIFLHGKFFRGYWRAENLCIILAGNQTNFSQDMDTEHRKSIFPRIEVLTWKLPHVAAASRLYPVKNTENTRRSLAMCDICVNTQQRRFNTREFSPCLTIGGIFPHYQIFTCPLVHQRVQNQLYPCIKEI